MEIKHLNKITLDDILENNLQVKCYAFYDIYNKEYHDNKIVRRYIMRNEAIELIDVDMIAEDIEYLSNKKRVLYQLNYKRVKHNFELINKF